MIPAPARPAPKDAVPQGTWLPRPAGDVVRVLVLSALVATPLLFALSDFWVCVGLYVIAYACGLFVLGFARWGHGGFAALPGGPAVAGFLALVALQLVPLPPALLRILSPGTFEFHERRMLIPLQAFKPVSVSPPDTFFGLVFLAGIALLYLAVFHAFASTPWRRGLLRTVVYVGLFMTLVALVQAASGARRLYGIFATPDDWAVFGPYLNRNHLAGYLLMPLGVALGFTAEALADLERAWTRRRVGWLALGEPVGSVFVRRAAEAMVLIVGLMAAGSRGAFVGFAFALLVLAAATRRRLLLAGVAVVAVIGVSWIGLDSILQGFAVRGFEGSRIGLWRDALRMFPDFPLLGTGFNAFGMAYLYYQTFWRYYFIQASHNEYLDLLLTTGLLGTALAIWGSSPSSSRGGEGAPLAAGRGPPGRPSGPGLPQPRRLQLADPAQFRHIRGPAGPGCAAA